MSCSEDEFKRVLASFSPTEVIQSESLRLCMIAFLKLATPAEARTLLPDYRLSVAKADQNEISQHLVKATSLDPSSPHVRNLCRVLKDLATFDCAFFDNTSLQENFWTSRGFGVPTHSDDEYKRVGDLVGNIVQLGNSEYVVACTVRFTILVLSHVVEILAATISAQERRSGAGTQTTTAALDIIAKRSRVKRTKLLALVKRKKNYFLLAEEGGIGWLLLGKQSAGWEKLRDADVPLIRDCRSRFFPSIEETVQGLNYFTACEIIKLMRAYGWSYRELATSGSRLMKLIGVSVDLEALCDGQIVPHTGCDKRPSTTPDCSPQPKRLCDGEKQNQREPCETHETDHSSQSMLQPEPEQQLGTTIAIAPGSQMSPDIYTASGTGSQLPTPPPYERRAAPQTARSNSQEGLGQPDADCQPPLGIQLRDLQSNRETNLFLSPANCPAAGGFGDQEDGARSDSGRRAALHNAPLEVCHESMVDMSEARLDPSLPSIHVSSMVMEDREVQGYLHFLSS